MDELKVAIETEADLFILEHKANKLLQKMAPDTARAPVVLVARELATNILKYGGKGFISLRAHGGRFTVVAEDDGTAPDPEACKGGLGVGLEVVRARCDDFSMERKPGGGMAVRAVVSPQGPQEKRGFELEIGIASRPHYLEEDNGDVVLARKMRSHYLLLVADVLGHGRKAGTVAAQIRDYAEHVGEVPVEEVFAGLERLLWDTRGCAAFVAMVSETSVDYVNVGNIKAWLIARDHVKKLESFPGIVGRLPMNRAAFHEHVGLSGRVLTVCTDGIRGQFVPRLDTAWLRDDPAEEAAGRVLLAHGLREDDASVLIAKGESMRERIHKAV